MKAYVESLSSRSVLPPTLCSIYTKFTKVTFNVVHPMYNTFSSLSMSTMLVYVN